LSQPTAGGEAAAATQRLGTHGSSQAQSLSFAHDAAARASAPDGVGGVAPGPGAGLTAARPGVAVPSVGAATSVLGAGGTDGAEGGVGLSQATIVRVAAIVRLAKSAVRFAAGQEARVLPGMVAGSPRREVEPWTARPSADRGPSPGAPPAERWLLIIWSSCRDELAPVRGTW
jgi:hypothetical protein